MQKWKNGDRAADKVTGFEGTVTAVCEYITGSPRCELTPRVDEDGKVRDPRWFDMERLSELTAS